MAHAHTWGMSHEPTKWIELIRLRSSADVLRAALPSLEVELAATEEATPLADAFVMTHALYSGDLAVVLVWRTDDLPDKSREGLLLARRLRELGPVEHAVWVPVRVTGESETSTHV